MPPLTPSAEHAECSLCAMAVVAVTESTKGNISVLKKNKAWSYISTCSIGNYQQTIKLTYCLTNLIFYANITKIKSADDAYESWYDVRGKFGLVANFGNE